MGCESVPSRGRSRWSVRRGRRSRHHLAQGGDLERIEMVADRARDEARGDRGAVIMQDRHQPDGAIPQSVTMSERSWAARVCSTTDTKSGAATKPVTLEGDGKRGTRSPVRDLPG